MWAYRRRLDIVESERPRCVPQLKRCEARLDKGLAEPIDAKPVCVRFA